MNWCLKILLISIFAASSAYGQDTTTSVNNPVANTTRGTATPSLSTQLSEGVQASQANNETYYQQALQNPSSAAGAVIKPSADSAMIATPDGPAKGTELNLTDAEKRLSEEYIHDGKALREQEELCAQLDDPNACRGSEPKSKFMGIDSGMVQALSKAYTMVVGAMDGGIKMKPESGDGINKGDPGTKTTITKNKDGSTTEKTEKTEKDRQDWCKYIAIGVEGVAFFQSNLSAQNAAIPTAQETAQKDILYKAARTHKDRAKTHKMQFVGWGATTACYTAMMATGADLTSWGNWLKLGGAGLMTMFFKQQADLNEDYYDKVKGIADKLPGKGDCNPVTEKDCYCAQEETMNDPQICLPELHGRNVKLGNYRVACMDANGKVDPKCTCVDADACLDQRFMNKIKPFGFGTAFNSAAYRPLSNLAKGQLTSGDLASASTGALAAFNRNGLQKIGSNIPSSGNLSKEQQQSVKDLSQMGIPPKLAALMAKQKLSPQAKTNFARFSGGSFGGPARTYGAFNARRGNVLDFSGGSGINKKVSRSSGGNQFNNLMNKFKKNGKTQNGGKVLNYESRAMQNADINKNKDRPIFEIISRRYQVSGFKRLDLNR